MKKLVALLLLVSSTAFALSNDKFGRAVTGPVTANGQDTYTDTDSVNTVTFTMSFPTGAALSVVYAGLESQAPPPSTVKNYAGLDPNSIVLLIQIGVTQAIMDALVSGGSIASYAVLDPNFPPPPIGAAFVPGSGQGNFMPPPPPFLVQTPANWPPPGGVPITLPVAVNQLATRLSVVNPTTPARTLNTNFTPNANRPVFACYTVQISCTLTVTGTCSSTVDLRSDVNATPVTVRGQAAVTVTLGVGVTVTQTNGVTQTLCYMVPTGHNVRLVTSSSGTATATLVQQVEEMIH